MTTEISKTPKNLSVFFPDVLKKIWKEGQRNWTFYSTDLSKHNWDIRTVEHRQK
jgi:hypothetical protein